MAIKLLTTFFEQQDADMLMEIEGIIDGMGGEIIDIDLETKFISITVDDEYQEEAQDLVNSIMTKYNNIRTEAMANPFFGVALIKGDLDDTE